MNEKTKIRLNKLAHNDNGVNGSIATSFFWPSLLAVSSANDFGTALFEASSTWVPSESSYKKQTTSFIQNLFLNQTSLILQTSSGRACLFGASLLFETRNYSISSKKALVARCTEREICKHDPSKKVVQLSCLQGDSELNPMWVTGFSDGEGSFTCSIARDKKYKHGWRPEPRFQIGLHKKDKGILDGIKKFIEVGHIAWKGSNAVQLKVSSLKEFEHVKKHFKKFQLITNKRGDFILICEIWDLMVQGKHLTPEGLRKIVAIRAAMNRGLSQKLKLAFPDVVPVERPEFELPQTIDPEWLAGFTSAEGSFQIVIKKSQNSVGFQVLLVLVIAQHKRDLNLMKHIRESLNCGVVFKNLTWLEYRVCKFQDVEAKIIPFFHKYKIRGVKAEDYSDWCVVAHMISEKMHLTKEGLEQIRRIKAGVNRGRKLD